MKNYEIRRSQFINDLEAVLYGAENDRLLLINPATLEMELSDGDILGYESHEIYDLYTETGSGLELNSDAISGLVDQYVFEHD